MHFEEYYDAALRTAIMRGLDFDLDHSIIGLTTEIGEYATLIKRNVIYGKEWTPEMRDHAREELGDICWYIPLGLKALGIPASRFTAVNPKPCPLGSVALVKKMMHGVSFLAAGQLNLTYQEGQAVASIIGAYGQILEAVIQSNYLLELGEFHSLLDGNIEKLRLRYPEKFTPELAERRLDKGGLTSRES